MWNKSDLRLVKSIRKYYHNGDGTDGNYWPVNKL